MAASISEQRKVNGTSDPRQIGKTQSSRGPKRVKELRAELNKRNASFETARFATSSG